MMSYTEEFFTWDTENSNNYDSYSGSYPYKKPGLASSYIRIDYCYYTQLNITAPLG